MKIKIIFLFFFVATAFASASESKTQLALNWKPEPEFGGFYEAQSKGFYKKAGFDVEILEGGSGTPTTQMLMNAKVDYAIVSSEEILLNNDRDPKRKIIALFSVFEKSPYMIMSHDSQNFKDLGAIFQSKTTTLSLQKGLPYVEFLIQKYSPVKAQLVPYSGGLSVFEKNKNFAQQGFITSEYLIAQNQKLNPKAFLVADEGFNPYLVVLAVREEFLKKHPTQVKKMVEATREGWSSYLKTPEQTNKLMNLKNPSMSAEMMTLSLNKMKELMHFEPLELGQMTSKRWQTLGQQMLDLKLITKKPETDKFFQTF
jgi:NitT/TauT family transport system substrate-binding protein